MVIIIILIGISKWMVIFQYFAALILIFELSI